VLFAYAPWRGRLERLWFPALLFLGCDGQGSQNEALALTSSFSTSYESIGSTSSSLLERVKANDQDAWQRLVKLYGPLVLFWLRRAHVHPDDRADVFQEVFRSASVGIGGFRPDRPGDTFRGWLRTITKSRTTDHFRRRSRQPDALGG